jgi:uncharacterized protein YdiU (UPF0061 family)
LQKVKLAFDNSFARELQGFYISCKPEPVPEPRLLFFNSLLAEELQLDWATCNAETQAALFSGNRLPDGAEPIAQAYAGHQFGHFSAQLGDGRALLIGEVIDRLGRRRDIAFKGSGRTPFSRSGDGKAAVGPMLREILLGEFMHAAGIPTTRALAVVSTGETVYREQALPGAVLTRVAASHVRIGTFEYFASRGAYDHVRQLAEYTIARHDTGLTGSQERYLEFLRAVTHRQATLVAQWMGIGFIHGVMNTDNMSIAGETIDYGPCAFMEAYDAKAVFSSIDKQGRYAYGNQPEIAQWNLARLAETLLPLLSDNEQKAIALASDVVDTFPRLYRQHWLDVMRAKLGLNGRAKEGDHADTRLAEEWLSLLQTNHVDFTLAWRKLADAAEGNLLVLRNLFSDQQAFNEWLAKWQARCAAEGSNETSNVSHTTAFSRAEGMRRVNPWCIPRNHRIEEVITAASDENSLEPFHQLLAALNRPYEELPDLSRFAEPAPAAFMANYRTFCGT